MPQPPDAPISTYSEHHPQVSRTFSLYSDRVVVQAHWRLKGEHQSIVQLDTLKPEFRTLRIRNKWYRYAGWILAGGLMTLAISVYNAKQLAGPVPYIGIAVAFVGIMLLLRTRRPVEFVRFDSQTGRGGLDIACTSTDKETFDRFVQSVRRQIRKAR